MNPYEKNSEGIVHFDPLECQLKQFKRNAYFNGKPMFAEDCYLEQKYINEKRYLINRLIHGTGIICGLEVKSIEKICESWRVNLTPGCAIDCCGREIVVSKGIQCSIITTVQGIDCSKYIGLYLRRKDILVDPIPNPICESSAEKKCYESHIEEQFEVFLATLENEKTVTEQVGQISHNNVKDSLGNFSKQSISFHDICKKALEECPHCKKIDEQGPKVLLAVLSCSQEGVLSIDYSETEKKRDIVYSNFILGHLLCEDQKNDGKSTSDTETKVAETEIPSAQKQIRDEYKKTYAERGIVSEDSSLSIIPKEEGSKVSIELAPKSIQVKHLGFQLAGSQMVAVTTDIDNNRIELGIQEEYAKGLVHIARGSLTIKCDKDKRKLPVYMISEKIPHMAAANIGSSPLIMLGKKDDESETENIQYLNNLLLSDLDTKSLTPYTKSDKDNSPKWLQQYISGSSNPVRLFVIELNSKDFRILSVWPTGCSETSINVSWSAVATD
jgi:hypothetical protein